MKLLRSLDPVTLAVRAGAVAIGNFDGVHQGHARIIERLRFHAARVGGPAVVFTFDPHPARLLRPADTPPALTWTERKAELLGGLGVDTVIAYPTDRQLLSLEPSEFFDRIVREKLQARAMVEGRNFYFGRNRSGTVEVLAELAAAAGIDLEVVEPVMLGSEPVSSSRVRRLLQAGKIMEANRLLTQPYRLRGQVVHGAGRGAKIGFPTANLSEIETLVPTVGIYAGRGFASGNCWPAAISIGPNPTFGEQTFKVEVHLVGCAQPLYGQVIEVEFLEWLRGMETFGSVDALLDQIRKDVRRTEEIVAQVGHAL